MLRLFPSFFLLIGSLLFFTSGVGQTLTQEIRGRVIDAESLEPLVGARVEVTDISPTIGALTNENGEYVLERVPVGRRTVRCSYVGYAEFIRDNLNINSAREYQLDMELRPGYDLDEVVVSAYKATEAVNEFQVASVRRLDPEELQYHAATGNDPSRLVQSLPGVQPGNDNRNEVVIRGNSPAGVLWRLEGIDIPNPNHYAGGGSSGGGITIFSASVIGSSDFSSGAFAAEYGNALSGVFDMHFRVGNKQEQQHTFRAGVLGLDVATEGPIVKGKSSYVANFRYSTLGILNSVGIYLVGPRIANNFYDFSFKVHHQSKKTQYSLWGIGGLSSQLLDVDVMPWTVWRQKYLYSYGSNTGVIGGTIRHIIDNQSFVEINAAFMSQNAYTADDSMRNDGFTTDRVKTETYINTRISAHAFYKR
ncbi:MAG: carboxypeptidase-like regulatory domain-containing protein, partial [Bacteroidia bacterium]|nr:carboxypeptidase-like regulatory domain-containing protein [Bacteroidia bacterium]